MKKVVLLLAVLVALPTGPSKAEGGCPPGQIPYSGTSLGSCGPIQGVSTPASPGPSWASRWGAIATDDAGAFGIVAEVDSKSAAKAQALKECRDRSTKNKCRLSFAYKNQCAVVVASRTASFSESAATLEEALENANQVCRKSSESECWIYYSGCSLPVRVR
ncbi:MULTISPECIES: DUF4189 domain-containing protein [unclassified Lysobacter]|uniref:DUF4189 domain-containing protein n=1 Tax=unclassified Lysobacter TaxID=2635362 RepID=UPI001BE7F2C6|nr:MULTISPECIES: DUF4189 domain-containing protein [unclassified Lysobacter]MBT2747216.1 DUF4189 domain-containing protein [Lysobacter sp. ISL-42]MBT2750280.1 DUF4189 domain-containing protein [Lysobacter sp. ISL-50]MBT2777754.1 DUF4189 domain-containing protein [Lysobacter sp. ISL-54]MBT2783690.1 DUF4189 domain-containing protein [Lysobacter sp. ISL-52]